MFLLLAHSIICPLSNITNAIAIISCGRRLNVALLISLTNMSYRHLNSSLSSSYMSRVRHQSSSSYRQSTRSAPPVSSSSLRPYRLHPVPQLLWHRTITSAIAIANFCPISSLDGPRTYPGRYRRMDDTGDGVGGRTPI
ncbi:hypothetical protein BJ912DRAFT_988836 [Pholiota molesta]|nr:hypothetical protein BJ912DRAFT_988836 [Pholiota molesta]